MNHLVRSSLRKKRFIYLFVFFILFCVLSNTVLQARKIYYIPEAPHGPEDGFTNIEYEFKIYTTNNEAQWRFNWDDGTTSEWLQLDPSQSYISEVHSWDNPGEYHVQVQFKSLLAPEGIWSESLTVSIQDASQNSPPQTPVIHTGVSQGCVNVEYYFTVISSDADSDRVQYRFDWDDQQISEWTVLLSSNTYATECHQWTETGTYHVKCQAQDANGLLSSWSDSFSISIFLDEDEDTLSDALELSFGSDKSDPSDVYVFTINYDRYYVVRAEKQDLFYNNSNKSSYPVSLTTRGYYEIDRNWDGITDYRYYPFYDSLIPETHVSFETAVATGVFYFILFLLLVGLVLSILFVLMKLGVIYIYQEIVIEESEP